MTERSGTALVGGASGLIGRALVEDLSARPDWHARALARRPHPSPETVVPDLTDAEATQVLPR
jgi:uncharacterized protein YbjT (DUF2867 family)